jgi:hypothetical protein
LLLTTRDLGGDDESAWDARNESPGCRDRERLILYLIERVPIYVNAAHGIVVIIESDGVEDGLFAGLDLDVAGEDLNTRYLLLSVLLRLDRLWGGAAVSRRAFAVPATRLGLSADVRQVLIAQPLVPGRPSARMPPKMGVLTVVDRRRRDGLDCRV